MPKNTKSGGEPLDPRISAMSQGQPPLIQFIAAALCSLLGKSETDKLIDQYAPRDIDWTEKVAGHPMHWWNGKTRDQIMQQLKTEPGDAKKRLSEIEDALDARGLQFPEDYAKEHPEEFPGDNIRMAGEGDDKGDGDIVEGDEGEPDNSAPSEETKFAGYPYSELRGKSDQELLAMQNVGERTIAKIREFEAANPEIAKGE